MPSYVVEAYVLDSPAAVEDATERARSVADEETAIRYVRTTFLPGGRGRMERSCLRSTYLPEDETRLHFFAAASGEEVAEAARQAGLTGDRITRSIDADQPSRRVHVIRRATTERGVP